MIPDVFMIVGMLDYRKHLIASYHATAGGDQNFDVKFQKGSKYIRVFTLSHGSRSCHSFIDAQGIIWKSASWKAPAKNFSRGNIKAPSTWTNIHWNGI
jgi:hypothetical protein